MYFLWLLFRACMVLARHLTDLSFASAFIQHSSASIDILKSLAKDCSAGKGECLTIWVIAHCIFVLVLLLCVLLSFCAGVQLTLIWHHFSLWFLHKTVNRSEILLCILWGWKYKDNFWSRLGYVDLFMLQVNVSEFCSFNVSICVCCTVTVPSLLPHPARHSVDQYVLCIPPLSCINHSGPVP